MIRKRRRETEIFSMSFMDCICCGFGAVLLIFILTTGRRVDFSQQDLKDLQERVRKLDIAVTQERSELDRLARATTVTEVDLKSLIEQNSSDKEKARVQQEQLKAMLQQSQQLHQTLAQLQTDIQKLPTEEEQPVPIPEVDRRQYLSGVKLDGEGAEYVLFIVRASGSMLGETLEDAVSRLEDPDFKKREAPKWQRVVKAIEWMIASLGPETKFHVLLFADETVPLLPSRGDDWIARKDKQAVREALEKLHQVVPQGSANLERAFTAVRYLPRLPDSIVLLTDGLPTTSDSQPNNGETDDDTRIRYFRYAQRQLPARIPVSTILFPMSGDPGTAALYWELASSTRGALVSPAKTWPDT
ncbi:MAG TPA: hypothetical protein VEB66_02195 [Opitutaceae bacterium]|nr:hypothetical protein [Opitutaceae bacterium]